MKTLSNGGLLIESAGELPALAGDELFLDFETTSGDAKVTSLNPWHNCSILGVCVCMDDSPAYYVPCRHQLSENLELDGVYRWLRDLRWNTWINHNVKYDAHVMANEVMDVSGRRLVDTVTLAKIIDSDRMFRGGYSLKALSKAWLHEDIDGYEDPFKPYLYRNRDYGLIPSDVMAPYGCQDALTERRLWKYLTYKCPDECKGVWDTEIALTELLYRMERTGLHVDPTELKVTQLKLMRKMLRIQDKIQVLTGRELVNPVSSQDCMDILVNQYGLPVLAWTNPDDDNKPSNPSFDKDALAAYAVHPDAPRDVVQLLLDYRKIDTLNNFFVRPYQELQVDGVLHSSYNQTVRTGRMSSKQPNSQQLSPAAKELIHPKPGHVFISSDASQIEFRTIVHYIKDEDAIAAYLENPDTDFHQWVADLCSMPRRPAKNVNFMMGYGGGKKKCVSMLAANVEVVGHLLDTVESLVVAGKIDDSQRKAYFEYLCRKKGNRVYRTYHERLPGIKATSRRAEKALKQKGYVRNLYGRHRHLPMSRSHIAFNTLNQSTAADLVKERMVALDLAIREAKLPVDIVAQVHDEIVLQAPEDIVNDNLLDGITSILENPAVDLRVPVRWEIGIGVKTWKEAVNAQAKRSYRPGAVKFFGP